MSWDLKKEISRITWKESHRHMDFDLYRRLENLIGDQRGYHVKCIYLTDDEIYRLTGKHWAEFEYHSWPHFWRIPIREKR